MVRTTILIAILFPVVWFSFHHREGCSEISSQAENESLAEARGKFQTKLTRQEADSDPLPVPPPDLFNVVYYQSPAGKLGALLTPDPKDNKKHPGIVWITSGNCNSIDDGIWKTLPSDFDQTSRAAKAFRQAGLVMMFPTLRGGNKNPGFKEGLYGEVDDVLSATEYLSKITYVDSKRIYLGGLSTGGTLVLLTAASSDRFRGVFSFGPASRVTQHSSEYLPFNLEDKNEIRLRSPLYWLSSIKNPTFVFEGMTDGNIHALRTMKKESKNPKLQFFPIKGAGHVTCLGAAAEIISKKIPNDVGPDSKLIFTEDELNKAFGK